MVTSLSASARICWQRLVDIVVFGLGGFGNSLGRCGFVVVGKSRLCINSSKMDIRLEGVMWVRWRNIYEMVAGFHVCAAQRLNDATSIDPSSVGTIGKTRCQPHISMYRYRKVDFSKGALDMEAAFVAVVTNWKADEAKTSLLVNDVLGI